MQAGEILRRTAFFGLDLLKGSRNRKLLKVNKEKLAEGVSDTYRSRRLKAILDYAREKSPFYGEKADRSELSAFPVMSKTDFLTHYDDVVSREYRDRLEKLPHFSTSGSTGTPFSVPADPNKLRHVNMNFLAVMELNGFRTGMKRGEFRAWIKGKNTRSPVRLFVTNLVQVDISNMGDERVGQIFEEIKKKRIQCLVAYSSAVTALTEYASKHGFDPGSWDVEMIFTMGEALPLATRTKSKELFGIDPVLSYGNNENGFIAVSLDGSADYTADLFSYHVEILKMDTDEPAGEGELGRIVVTDYYNRAFPMIRYDTGDTGRLITEKRPDGRIRARFTEIFGRRGSLIYNTKGEPLSIHVFLNNMLNFEGVLRQAKCIQTGVKEYTLMLNPEEGASVDEAAVKASYARYLGEDAVMTIEYTDALPIQQSGKTMVSEQRCKEYM